MSDPSPATSGWRGGWYVVPHEVTWRDIDGIGHVNNAVYFTFFEWARTKYWFELQGVDDRVDLGGTHLGFIVARAECDFRAQLGLCDRIEIRCRIGEMRNSSLDFEYEIVRPRDGVVAATGRVVVVLFSWKTNAKLAIDQELRERIRLFQEGGGQGN